MKFYLGPIAFGAGLTLMFGWQVGVGLPLMVWGLLVAVAAIGKAVKEGDSE